MYEARSPRVWITRTQPGADACLPAWREAGFDPMAAPLLELTRVEDVGPVPAGAELVFTSANGVRFAPDLAKNCRVYCIGPATARAARDAGFADVRHGVGDWTNLLGLIEPSNAPIVHIGGQHVRGRITEALRERGRTASRRVVYRSEAVTDWPLDTSRIELAALYSPLAAATLMSLPDRPMAFAVVALSEAVAAPLRQRIDRDRLHVARQPTDAAMIEAAAFAVGLDPA